jgi:hypothetical protein
MIMDLQTQLDSDPSTVMMHFFDDAGLPLRTRMCCREEVLGKPALLEHVIRFVQSIETEEGVPLTQREDALPNWILRLPSPPQPLLAWARDHTGVSIVHEGCVEFLHTVLSMQPLRSKRTICGKNVDVTIKFNHCSGIDMSSHTTKVGIWGKIKLEFDTGEVVDMDNVLFGRVPTTKSKFDVLCIDGTQWSPILQETEAQNVPVVTKSSSRSMLSLTTRSTSGWISGSCVFRIYANAKKWKGDTFAELAGIPKLTVEMLGKKLDFGVFLAALCADANDKKEFRTMVITEVSRAMHYFSPSECENKKWICDFCIEKNTSASYTLLPVEVDRGFPHPPSSSSDAKKQRAYLASLLVRLLLVHFHVKLPDSPVLHKSYNDVARVMLREFMASVQYLLSRTSKAVPHKFTGRLHNFQQRSTMEEIFTDATRLEKGIPCVFADGASCPLCGALECSCYNKMVDYPRPTFASITLEPTQDEKPLHVLFGVLKRFQGCVESSMKRRLTNKDKESFDQESQFRNVCTRISSHDYSGVTRIFRRVSSHSISPEDRQARPTETGFVDYLSQFEANPNYRADICLATRFSRFVPSELIYQALDPFLEQIAKPFTHQSTLRGRILISGHPAFIFHEEFWPFLVPVLQSVIRKAAVIFQSERLHDVSIHSHLDDLTVDVTGLPGRFLRPVLMRQLSSDDSDKTELELLNEGALYMISGPEQLQCKAVERADQLQKNVSQGWTAVFCELDPITSRCSMANKFHHPFNGVASRVQYSLKNKEAACVTPTHRPGKSTFTEALHLETGTDARNWFQLSTDIQPQQDSEGVTFCLSFGPQLGLNHEDALCCRPQSMEFSKDDVYTVNGTIRKVDVPPHFDTSVLMDNCIAAGRVKAGAILGFSKKRSALIPVTAKMSGVVIAAMSVGDYVHITVRHTMELEEGDKLTHEWQKQTVSFMEYPLRTVGLPIDGMLHESAIFSRQSLGMFIQAMKRTYAVARGINSTFDAFRGPEQEVLREEARTSGEWEQLLTKCSGTTSTLSQAVYGEAGNLRGNYPVLMLRMHIQAKHHPSDIINVYRSGIKKGWNGKIARGAKIEPLKQQMLTSLGHTRCEVMSPENILSNHENTSISVCGECGRIYCDCDRRQRRKVVMGPTGALLSDILGAQDIRMSFHPGQQLLSRDADDSHIATCSGTPIDGCLLAEAAEVHYKQSRRHQDIALVGQWKFTGNAGILFTRALVAHGMLPSADNSLCSDPRGVPLDTIEKFLRDFIAWLEKTELTALLGDHFEVEVPLDTIPRAIAMLVLDYAHTHLPVKIVRLDDNMHRNRNTVFGMHVPLSPGVANTEQELWLDSMWTPDVFGRLLRSMPVRECIPEGRTLLKVPEFCFTRNFISFADLVTIDGSHQVSSATTTLCANIQKRLYTGRSFTIPVDIETVSPAIAGRSALPVAQSRSKWNVNVSSGALKHLTPEVCPQGVFSGGDIEDLALKHCTGCRECERVVRDAYMSGDVSSQCTVSQVEDSLVLHIASNEEGGPRAVLLGAAEDLVRQLCGIKIFAYINYFFRTADGRI